MSTGHKKAPCPALRPAYLCPALPCALSSKIKMCPALPCPAGQGRAKAYHNVIKVRIRKKIINLADRYEVCNIAMIFKALNTLEDPPFLRRASHNRRSFLEEYNKRYIRRFPQITTLINFLLQCIRLSFYIPFSRWYMEDIYHVKEHIVEVKIQSVLLIVQNTIAV